MGMVAVLSNAQVSVPVEMITQGGAIATVSLIISLSFALLIADSKYWNSWAQSTLDISSKSLLLTFAAIILFKIILII
jgi:hypothetical protein